MNKNITYNQDALDWLYGQYFVDRHEETNQLGDGAIDLEVLHQALNKVPPDDYETWIKTGMALKSAGVGLEVWDNWSQGSSKYESGQCAKKWSSFNGTKISIGSVFHIAQQHGFKFPAGYFSKDNLEPDWLEPEEIKPELLPVPPFPEELIPDSLRGWCTDVAHRMQVPLSFAAASALVIAGSSIGTACGIRPKLKDDWLVIPNLWGGIVASPGKLKSPTLEAITKPLSKLEMLAKEDYEKALTQYKLQLEEFKSRKDVLQGLLKEAIKRAESKSSKKPSISVDQAKKRLQELEEPEMPIWRRYKTNDTTVPKLHELLSANPRGMLIMRDELKGLLASLDQQDKQADKAFYLEGWNGYGSFTYDRMERGSIFVDNVCLSILGGIQPDKLRSYLYSAMRGADDDGLIQRFQLMVFPDDIDWQYVDELPNKEERDKAYSILTTLAQADFTVLGAKLDEGENIPYFKFSPDAQEFFKSWLIDLEVDKLHSKEEPVLLEHLSKYRSLMPSLALTIHLSDVVSGFTNGDVSLEAAEKAAAWCDYLEQHARRIYGLVANIRQKAALSLVEKLLDKQLADGFTAREVYIHGWSCLTTADEAQAALNELVLKKWLREKHSDHSSIRYQINPKIYQTGGLQ